MSKLEGRLVLITGGARGIGRCCAQALIASGARVILADIDASEAKNTASALGPRAVGFGLDVSDTVAFKQCAETIINEMGPINILINNAGVMHIGPTEELSRKITQRMIQVNVLGVLNGVHAVRPSMQTNGGGLIINIASLVARLPVAYAATYSATKAAVASLTESLRLELHDEGIRFMGVYPGYVRTDLTSGVPLPRFPNAVTPEDVAKALVQGIQRKRASVYVPSSGRLLTLIRPFLPLRLARLFGELTHTADLFKRIDAKERQAYRTRTKR